jgi:N-methylhydantoinase B
VEHLSAGDVISLRTPAGGGYGDPLTRDCTKVLDDVLDGFVSAERAREIYGVVLDGSAIDAAATDAARSAVQSAQAAPRYDFGEGRSSYMRQFPAAVLDELSELLAGLPSNLRYRAKQVAVAAMREQFSGSSVPQGWLTAQWRRVEGTLFGSSRVK